MKPALAVTLALLPLAGCARRGAALPPVPPRALQACPTGAIEPVPPPAPRSIKALLNWAISTEQALVRTEDARRECADRLLRLNEWIVDHQVH